jgi:gluconolactonase
MQKNQQQIELDTPATLEEIATGLKFPEGPIALKDGTILVCEVAGKAIHRIRSGGERTVVSSFEGGPSGAAFGPDGKLYVCNSGRPPVAERNGVLVPAFALDGPPTGCIERVDVETGEVEKLYHECDGKALRSPNDLVFDAYGGIWFTDHGNVRENERDHGAVYYAKADGSYIRREIYPLLGPNGIGLSPDGNRLYVAETPTARVWWFELSGPGEIVRTRGLPFGGRGHLLAGFADYRMFDSLAVDARGWVSVATLIKGGITSISPDGSMIEFLKLPDRYTSNICFGGPGLNTAYVTLGETGRVIALPWPRPGAQLNYAK